MSHTNKYIPQIHFTYNSAKKLQLKEKERNKRSSNTQFHMLIENVYKHQSFRVEVCYGDHRERKDIFTDIIQEHTIEI